MQTFRVGTSLNIKLKQNPSLFIFFLFTVYNFIKKIYLYTGNNPVVVYGTWDIYYRRDSGDCLRSCRVKFNSSFCLLSRRSIILIYESSNDIDLRFSPRFTLIPYFFFFFIPDPKREYYFSTRFAMLCILIGHLRIPFMSYKNNLKLKRQRV